MSNGKIWFMSILLGVLVLVVLSINASAGDWILDDWEDGDMTLPDDRDGTSGYKSGWYMNDALSYYWDSGWGMNTDGYPYYDTQEPYEGDYCALGQLYGSNDNNTLYFYIDLSADGYATTGSVYISFWYHFTEYRPSMYYPATSFYMYVYDDDDGEYVTLWNGSVTDTTYYNQQDHWKHVTVEIKPKWYTQTLGQNTEIYFTHKTTTSGYPRYYRNYVKIDYLEVEEKENPDFSIDNMTATPVNAEVNTTCFVRAALRNDGWANYGSSITISLQVEDSSGSTVVTDSYTHSGGLDVDEWTWVYFNWSHVSTSGLETYNVTVSVDMSNDQDSIDDALTTQVKRYWIKWWEDFETGDFDAPNPAMNGSWWVSDPLGDNGGGYYDGGAGLNTDSQYTYPYGSTDPYEGRYCAIERLSRYESIYDVSAYVAFNMSGWDNVGIAFYYDTYVRSYYLYYNYYHAEVLVSDDNGSSWTLLGELNKDTTVNNWQAVSFDISGNPNVNMTSNVTIRFRFYTTNIYAYATYYFKWDAIAMTGDPYDKDIAVRALEIPGTSIRLSETIDITATVKNVGKDTINNVPVRCVVTDAQGSEEVNTTKTISTLESLWSRDVTWSFTPTDVTRYYINVSVDVSGDEVPYNDEMSAWFDSLPLVFMETFEDGDTNATNNGIPADEGWYIPYPYGDQSGYYDAGAGLNTENTYAWNKNAYEGTYCGMESVSRYDSNDVWMDVSFLDTDYRSPLTISFMWDTYGSGSYYEAWVKVSYDGGDTWTELNDGYSFTMDYTNDNWQLHEEQLPDFTTTPDNITVRFEFKTASSYPYGSPYWWFKFDNIAIRFPLENDLAATGLDVPSIAGAGEVIPIDVTVKNKGYKNQTGFDVYVYVYNENGSLYGTYSETVSQTLAAGEEMAVTVDTGPIVFSSGKRNFKVRADVDLSGDQDLTNNKIGPVDMTVAWLAFFDTFESGDLVAPGAIWGWNISDPITPGSYYDSGGGLNTQRYGNYPSGSTDAYQGTYCGIEYFGYDYSARTITMDVNIWVNEWEDLELSFWYDTYAYSYYSYRFHFEIYAYNGSAWIRLNGDSELPKDMSVNNWALYSENLSANSYFDWSSLENFTLRFQARKDYGYSYYGYNYFKFDNIMLSGAPPANDAAVVAVDLSRRKVTAGQDIDITATVKNAGGDFQSSIQVRLEIYDQWGTLKESDYTKYATDLDPGETATKSYTWTTDDKPSTYTVVIEVVLSGDSNPWNDEMQATFETGLFVFYDDFEDGDTDVTNNELPADEGWEISRRIPPNAMGSGAGVTSSNDHYYSSHGSAYNGHYCMIMQLDYYTREVTVNFTLDMSSYRGAKIQFWYDTFLYYYYASTHFIEVMVNNNSGSGWVTISEDSDFVKDYTANNWNLYKDTIDGDYMTDELTVQIRYRTTRYSWYYYYFKFDDIMLTFLPRHDLSVISVEAPPQANPGEWITVNATVTNEGWETKSNFDVVFEAIYDSNGTVADRQTVTVPDSIAMFETTYVEFQFRSEIWEKTEYTLIVYTALPTDQDDSNNASSIPFVGVWTLFWEDYEGKEKLVASGRFVTGGWWINEPLGDQSYYYDSGAGRSDDVQYGSRVRYGQYCGHEQLAYTSYENVNDVYMEVYLRGYNWTNVTINFDYSWYLYTGYPLYATIEVYNGTDWWVYNLPRRSYDRNWYNSGDISIPDYMMAQNTTLRIRYRNTGYSWQQYYLFNFEIDNILLIGVAPKPVPNDIGVEGINAPAVDELINYNDGYYIINASVGNYGSNQVTFTADVTCTNLEYGEVEYPDYVSPSDGEHTIDPVRFPPNLEYQTWNWTPELHGTYLINVTVTLSSGTPANTWNDYYTILVTVASVVFDTDFEDSDENFTHWGDQTGFDEWEYGVPSYSTNTQGGGTVDYAYSGTKCWGVDLDGPYDTGYNYPQEYLESPELDIRSGYTAFMTMYHWYDCAGYGSWGYSGGNVKISTDGGLTYEILHPVGGYPASFIYGLRGGDSQNTQRQPGWSGQKYTWRDYSSGGWVPATFDLSDYVGHTIKLRFQFGPYSVNWYGSPGWYIDNIKIWSLSKKYDLSPSKIVASADYPAFEDVARTGTETTRAEIMNNGLHTFTADYEVNLAVHETRYVNLVPNGDIEDPISWYWSSSGVYSPTYAESRWCRYGWGYTDDHWEDGTPQNVGPDSAHSGSRCIGYDIDGNAGGGNYRYEWFTTPAIYVDPTKGEVDTVTFWEYQDTVTYHYRYLYISKDGGYYGWVRYEYYQRTDTNWVQYSIDISDVQEKFRLRFLYYTGYGADGAPGWYIDDIEAMHLQVSSVEIYNDTQTVTDDLGVGEIQNVTWNWNPSDEGYYFYNVSIISSDDEYADNDVMSQLVFIGKWFDVFDFEDTPHDEDFTSEDLSGYGDLWHIVSTNSTWFDSWSSTYSDYAWWCGYESSSKSYPHAPIGNMTGSYDLGMDNVLITPEINLRYANMTYLTFWHREKFQHETEGYNGDGSDDGAWVEVTDDGGLTWTPIMPTGGYNGQIRMNALSRGAGYYAWLRWSGWTRSTFDLSQFAGDRVQIRFRFTSYWYSDLYADLTGNHGWYIDDILIYGSEYSDNAGLGHVLLKQETYNGGTFVEDVEMTIHLSGGNLGTSSSMTVNVDISIEDENGFTVYTSSMSTSDYQTWTRKWTPDEPGWYTITVDTNADPDDENPDDNNFTQTFWLAALAIYEDVESGAGEWTHGGAQDFWHIDDINYNSESHAWYCGQYDPINETWTYAPNTQAALASPQFDLRSFRSATMTWASWWSLERDHDGFNIQFSEDGDSWTSRFADIGQSSHGVFWQNPTLGHPTYSVMNSFNLANFVGKKVFMRIILNSDRNSIVDGDGNPDTPSGVFIDDIMIFGDQYMDNVGIDAIWPAEGTHLRPGIDQELSVNVTNLGRDDQNAVRVTLTVVSMRNGSELHNESSTLSLESLETARVSTTWSIPGSMNGEEIIVRAVVEIRNETGQWTTEDENPSDNTMEQLMDVLLWHDLAVDDIIVNPIVQTGEPVEITATITNYGNVEESDFNVTFCAGNISLRYPGVKGDMPHILIYDGYPYGSHTPPSTYWYPYYEAVLDALERLGAQAEIQVKKRTTDSSTMLNQSNIDWADIIIVVQRYGPIGYYYGTNNPDVALLEDFLDDGGSLWITGEYVTYYGTYYYYYRDFCRNYLKAQWSGYVYSYPWYEIDFTGEDDLISEKREWAAYDYGAYSNMMVGSQATRLFSFDRGLPPNNLAGIRFDGTYAQSAPFKTLYIVHDYYTTRDRSTSGSYSYYADQYEKDLAKNILNWFLGERTLNMSNVRDLETFPITGTIQPGRTWTLNWTWDELTPEFDTYDICTLVNLTDDNMTVNNVLIEETMGRTIKFSDDFEDEEGPNWTHYGQKDQWQRVSMIWHEGQPEQVELYNSPDHAWWCGNVNTSKYIDNSNAFLETPWLNLTTMSDASIGFWMRYATETGHDFLRVYVETPDLLFSEAVSPPIDGYNLEWQWFSYNLTEYVGGEVKIIFVFISDGNGVHESSELWLETGETWSGTFIDDVIVYGIEYSDNVAPKITAPQNGSVHLMNTDVQINASITNRGVNDQYNVHAWLRIYETENPANVTLRYRDLTTGGVDILSGHTVNLPTFTWTTPSRENVEYTIEVSTNMTGDENPLDDIYRVIINVRPRYDAAAVEIEVDDIVKYGTVPSIRVTYQNLGNTEDEMVANVSILKLRATELIDEDLNSGLPPNWTEEPDGNWDLDTTFRHGTTGASMHGVSPYGSYDPNARLGITSWVTPEIDLSVSPTPVLSFWQMYNIDPFDGCLVMVSTDGGTTWESVEPAGGYPDKTRATRTGLGDDQYRCFNGYQPTWERVRFDLTNYFGSKIHIRFTITYDESMIEERTGAPVPGGWFIDDIRLSGTVISEYIANNSYASSMLGPLETETQDWTEWTAEYGQYFVRLSVETLPDDDENLSNNVLLADLSVANIHFRDDADTYKAKGWTKRTTPNTGEWHMTESDYDGNAWWCGDDTTGTYDSGIDNQLITRSINLIHTEFTYIRFWHKYSFMAPEIGNLTGDTGHVEVAQVDEFGNVTGDWETVRTFELVNNEWHREMINISSEVPAEMLGHLVRFRFRVESGPQPIKPGFSGWYIDDIIVFGQPYEINIGIHKTYVRPIYSAEETYDDSDSDHPALRVSIVNYGMQPISVSGVTVTLSIDALDPLWTYNTTFIESLSGWVNGTELGVLEGTNVTFNWRAPRLPSVILNNILEMTFEVTMADDLHSEDNVSVETPKLGKMLAYWNWDDGQLHGWTPGDGWQLSDYRSAGGYAFYCGDDETHEYGAGWQTHLVSPMIFLSAKGDIVLQFWHKYDFNTSDYAEVYIFVTDDPDDTPTESDWRLLARYEGTMDPIEDLDLSDYAWNYVQLRFSVYTNDDEFFGEGWYLDEVAIYGLEPYAAGLIAPSIRNDYIYPKPSETGSTIEYPNVQIGNLGSNSDTIYWNISIRSKFKFQYVYTETNKVTGDTQERTRKGTVWFDALNWSISIWDHDSETWVLQNVKINDTTLINDKGERIYSYPLSLAPGEVRHWSLYLNASDEDHYHMIDAWKGTYLVNMSAESLGADETSEWKSEYRQLTPDILPPDVSLTDNRVFLDIEEGGAVLRGQSLRVWLLIPNAGTYMHNLTLSIWVTGGRTGVEIVGPTVTGDTETRVVPRGEKARFYIGAPDLMDTFGTGNETYIQTVTPPSTSDEMPLLYRDGNRYLPVTIELKSLPESTRSNDDITIHFELSSKEWAESEVATEMALNYANIHNFLPSETSQYSYEFVEIRAHLEDSRPGDNVLEKDITVVDTKGSATGFMPGITALSMAAMLVALAIYARSRRED